MWPKINRIDLSNRIIGQKKSSLSLYNFSNQNQHLETFSTNFFQSQTKTSIQYSCFCCCCSSMSLEAGIERVLWTESEIAGRVSELADEISRDLKDSKSQVVVVGVATGAFLFLADLIRKIKLPIAVDFIRVESYGSGTKSNGAPRISCDLKVHVEGKNVILVEDIVDTGNTLSCLISHLASKGASSISVCTFLDKPARRQVSLNLVGDGKFYHGFECPDYFVVGYGMDFAELYRNLPYIGILKPEMYR